MGLGVWPVFNPRQGIHPQLDGKLLLDEIEKLDALAAEVGVVPPSRFADNRALPKGFDGDPDTLDEVLGPWEEWFGTNEAVVTFAGLVKALEGPEGADRFDYPGELLLELREVERCLRQAQVTGARFRLEVL